MSGQSSLSKALGRTLDANLRYSALATELATKALESAFSIAAEIGPQIPSTWQPALHRSSQPEPGAAAQSQPEPAAIVLEGASGSTAIGFFVVENCLPHEILTPVEVSPLVAPNGREIQSALRFDPGTITLAAGQRVVARVSAKISRRLVIGERYQGEIRVPGVAGARIPIVLRRKADAALVPSSREEVAPASPSMRKKKSPLPRPKSTRPGKRSSK